LAISAIGPQGKIKRHLHYGWPCAFIASVE
jgi:hypothetical protein